MPFSTRETISLLEVDDYTEIVPFLPKSKLIYRLKFIIYYFSL